MAGVSRQPLGALPSGTERDTGNDFSECAGAGGVRHGLQAGLRAGAAAEGDTGGDGGVAGVGEKAEGRG